MSTHVFCLFYRYVDFTSLYPWCNKNTRNVVGHPQIITENFADISTYFGLIKCTILPPRGLLHPVLPYRTPENLMFPLCKTCADTKNQNPCTHTDHERAIRGTWCHVEVMKAIEKGYVVLNLHEVWHWEETSDELFKEYVNTFLKIKQEASGYPPWCVTDEQKQQYIDDYYEREGIRLDPNEIVYNPGLRYLAKLMLNSLWGKLLFFYKTLTLVSSAGRAWDCSEKTLTSQGSLSGSGSIPERGILMIFLFSRQICTTVQSVQNRRGDGTQGVLCLFVFGSIYSQGCPIDQR